MREMPSGLSGGVCASLKGKLALLPLPRKLMESLDVLLGMIGEGLAIPKTRTRNSEGGVTRPGVSHVQRVQPPRTKLLVAGLRRPTNMCTHQSPDRRTMREGR